MIESVQKPQQEGFGNALWIVTTNMHRYVFRDPLKKIDAAQFDRIIEISKIAVQVGIGANLVGANTIAQQTLIEYVEPQSWPSYEDNPRPYHETMKPLCSQFKKREYPFNFIFQNGERLEKLPQIPSQLSLGLEKCRLIFSRIQPLIASQETVCHGDFHMGNVLLLKKDLKPILIDFDTVCAGESLFDVVKFSIKFSIKFSPQVREDLYREYLGNRPPSSVEKAHFDLMDLALLMVVAVNRLCLAQNCEGNGLSRLSKQEMEEMLRSASPLPSFLKLPFGDASLRARQTGGCLALHEFLQKTTTGAFSRALETVCTKY
jgi:hypothetical protein